ncbi:MAG: phytanoyl-CoA dioxygenase family protein [Chloroflexota bacterium]|nr:phytanoyl-CoA dioxygenase family protein [Chloroflexota bacterium]MCY3581799.1 phytanoyl-CoA dioxygenase family protein [Chloroflexota bacterium]MDE2649683.1 phytanoyl-CoA dioxygenase family protein [Chloroflexota bacterium]
MRIEHYAAKAPPAGLYDYGAQVTSGSAGFADVRDADIEQFHRLGFLVVHDAFAAAQVSAARAGLHAALMRGGDNIIYEAVARDQLPAWSQAQRLDSVRKLMPIIGNDARLQACAENPGLLDVVGRILGEQPALSQDMALLKPPLIGREKPWHQDMAYFDYPAGTTIVGAWIALDEALPENGCMMLIPGSHLEGPVLHWQRRDWQICDTDVPVGHSVAVPLRPGGCLLFHCLLQHGTPPSRSRRRRWALQFHYRRRSVQSLRDSAQRLQIFGADGKDASC